MLSTDRFLRDRGPVHFNLGSTTISRRGWSEFRPRQIEIDKLIATLLLHTASNEDRIRAAQAIILTDYSASASKRARRFLWQRFPLLVLPFGMDLFWEMLFALDQPTAICHIASGHPDFDIAWRKAANTIAEMDPKASADFFSNEYASWTWRQGKPVLFEEAPGKTRLLELESKTERAWSKAGRAFHKYSPAMIQDQNQQILVREGWGASAFILDPGGSSICVQTRTLELNPDGYGLGFGRQVALEVGQWLEAAGFPAIESYVSTMPSLALNADLSRHLQKEVRTPDIQYGWNPVQTTIAVLTAPTQNTLIISLGQFPLMNLTYIGASCE